MKNIADDIIIAANQDILQSTGVSANTYRLIYKGNPPWEINQPQPAIIELEQQQDFEGPILDIGCGYGATVQYLATKGYQVCGIDYLSEVIKQAKVLCDHPNATFELKDALKLNANIKTYKTFIDSATFHGFSNEQRITYINQFKTYMNSNSSLYLLGFSILESRPGGPRRLSEETIREFFSDPIWEIVYIKNTRYQTQLFEGGAKAILAKILKK